MAWTTVKVINVTHVACGDLCGCRRDIRLLFSFTEIRDSGIEARDSGRQYVMNMSSGIVDSLCTGIWFGGVRWADGF